MLKKAGFTCGAEGRFLKGRDPAWTCIYDGKQMKGDLYVHHVDKLRAEGSPDWMGPALALLVAAVVGAGSRRWYTRFAPQRHSRGGTST